jgi:hypothetical protein
MYIYIYIYIKHLELFLGIETFPKEYVEEMHSMSNSYIF